MQVIGHRGAPALTPENTWASFDVALELGVDAIETDVRATSDGELVLIHDERLDRTTNGQGLVHCTPWPVVKTLDAGLWYGESFRGARVPSLVETLARYGPRNHLVLEIKGRGVELLALEMVRQHDLLDRVTFTSFHFDAVQRIKTAVPKAMVGFLARDTAPDTVGRVLEARLDQLCPPANTVTRDQVQRWKALGLEVRAWGVRDTALMLSALEAGVDGMTVDFPHLLLEALGRS